MKGVIRLHKALLVVFAFVLLSVVAGADEPLQDGGYPLIPTETSEWSHVIVLPVEIDGTNGAYLFMVDTRAPIGLVDPRLLKFMQGRLSKGRYLCPKISTEGCVFESAAVRCEDLAPLREQTGHHIDGILGVDQLRNMYFRIDVARGRFLTGLPGDVIQGTHFGLTPDKVATDLFIGAPKNVHLFEADFASRPILTLESKLFESLVAEGEISLYEEDCVDMFHEGVIARIGIKDEVYTKVPVHRGMRNSFGLLLFQNDTLALGANSNEAALLRNTAPRMREWVPWHGLAVTKPNGRVSIDRVAPRGPAAKAGLVPGDVIESINNGPVRYLPVSEVEFHDAWDTGRVEIGYRRNGEVQKTTIVRDKRSDGNAEP